MDSPSIMMYVTLVILVALSAFFSACETAFSTVNKIRLRNYADSGSTKAKLALEIAENYDKALSTILVGNNVVNIASASIATVLATSMFGASGAAISTVVTTIVVLIFGEILPKSYAKENSDKLALMFSGILKFLMTALMPVVIIFIKLKDGVSKLYKQGESHPSVTEEELKYIIESIEEEGVLEEQESELVQSALEFDEISVQEILTPRVDMVAVEVGESLDVVKELVLASHYSRIPVYDGNIDSIVGILHIRDLLESLLKGEQNEIRHLLGDCLYIHKTMRISSLLNEFKRKKMHLAVVTDDYGGTMGIVTMEDILEQLVGDIWDEYDEIVNEFVQISEDSFAVSGDMNIYELFEKLDIEDRNFESEYNTMGGWVLEMLGKIPAAGDRFDYGAITITVQEMDEQRVTKLIVQLHTQTEETEA